METVYVFLADGFEEIEALAPVDILRRAGMQVRTVGVTGKTVTGAHGVPVVADLPGEAFLLPGDACMVVLPGGGTGTENLLNSEMVADVLKDAKRRELHIAAICAAPRVLHAQGLLQGVTATAYPSVQKQLAGANVTGAPVEVDGKIITARAAGVALEFAHALVAALGGQKLADDTLADIYPAK